MLAVDAVCIEQYIPPPPLFSRLETVNNQASVQQDPAQSSPIERRTRSGHGDQHSAFVVPTATPATAPSAYQGRLGAAAIAAGPRGQGVSRRGGENSILTREHRRGSSSADSGQQHHQHNPTPGSFGSAGGACVGTRGGGSKTEDGPPPARSRRTQEQRQHSHGSPYAQGGRSWESSRESGRGSGNVAESKGSADFGDTEALPRGGEGAAVDGVRTSRSRSPSPPSRVGGLMSTSERLMGSDGRFLSSNDDLGGKTGPSSKGRGSGNISHASPFVHTRWAASGATETPRIMERSEWGQGERGQWTPSATLRRMESTGSAARSARRKRKGSEGAQVMRVTIILVDSSLEPPMMCPTRCSVQVRLADMDKVGGIIKFVLPVFLRRKDKIALTRGRVPTVTLSIFGVWSTLDY